MKRLLLCLLVVSALFGFRNALALEWPGVEGKLGVDYRVPVYASWGVHLRAETWQIPKQEKDYQSAEFGLGWYCGVRWYSLTVGLLRNWYEPGNEALMWGLTAGAADSTGHVWVEGVGRLIASSDHPHQYLGQYSGYRRFGPLLLGAYLEQRNLNSVRFGPAIGLCNPGGLMLTTKWLIWRDIDVIDYPASHTVQVSLVWRYPLPGAEAKKAAGY